MKDGFLIKNNENNIFMVGEKLLCITSESKHEEKITENLSYCQLSISWICYDFMERSDALLEKMEYVWMEYIVEIQNMPNVVGVYVSGKGVFLDAFNNVVLQKNIRAPTLVHRVELQALTRKDLETIFETNPKLVKYFQNKRIYEFILTFVLSESGGVPLIVSLLLWELAIRHSNSKKDIIQHLKEAMNPIPEMITLPHSPSKTPYCISS